MADKILYYCEDADSQQAIEQLLSGFSSDFESKVAGDVVTALNYFVAERPNAVFIDVVPDDEAARILLRNVRNRPEYTQCVVTVIVDGHRRARGAPFLEQGADMVILKPFPLRFLISQIRSILRLSSRVRPGVKAEAGDYAYDLFLASHRRDRKQLQPLLARLEGLGQTVWSRDSVLLGVDPRAAARSAIESSRHILAVWTEQSVHDEDAMTEAVAGSARLVQVCVGGAHPPMGFGRHQTFQVADMAMLADDAFVEQIEMIVAG